MRRAYVSVISLSAGYRLEAYPPLTVEISLEGSLHLISRAESRQERGHIMKADRVKREVTLRDSVTGELLARAELTNARVRALIKAYALAGIEAIAI